jgi:hypothetical protein
MKGSVHGPSYIVVCTIFRRLRRSLPFSGQIGEEIRGHRTPLSLFRYKSINGKESFKNAGERFKGNVRLAGVC